MKKYKDGIALLVILLVSILTMLPLLRGMK
jgi:hypothetical protein